MLIDIDGILAAVERSWAEMSEPIFDAHIEAIESKIYGWDNPTRRSNGEIVTSPRDIVDTGAFRDSQSTSQSSNVHRLDWDVDYAADIHKSRPWTQAAIAGDETADPDYQNPNAILNVPTAFAERFRANYRRS